MIASLGGDIKPLALVSFILVLQLEGDVKEPECSKRAGGSDLCRHRSGWAKCDQNVDWSGCKSAPSHADVRSHLAGSSAIQPLAASEESWYRLFFYLFIFIYVFLVMMIGKILSIVTTQTWK